jgi:hypothetical protein
MGGSLTPGHFGVYSDPPDRENPGVSKFPVRNRSQRGAVRTVTLLWSLWWSLPPSGRRQLIALARRHGPWLMRREFDRHRKS